MLLLNSPDTATFSAPIRSPSRAWMEALQPQIPRRPAVVILNFGGPRELSEVRAFLYEILRDSNTIQLPAPRLLQDLLASRIARKRAPELIRQYGTLGGRSPIVTATEAIAASLAAKLQLLLSPMSLSLSLEDAEPPPVFIVHRYLPGHAANTVRAIVASGADALLTLPMYPHFSYATTGSALEQLAQELEAQGWEGPVHTLRSYPDDPRYVEALATRLNECLQSANPHPAETLILCSAHGLPRSYVEQGDPYRLELYRTLHTLQARFPGWRFALSYQSRVGPAEWLKPYTDELIPELPAAGVKQLVFLPISFVNDHIETLYEIGETYFALARQHGLTPHRVAAIEDHPAHIELLADTVRAWLAGRGGVPSAECLPPSQRWRRVGRYCAALWAATLFGALTFALCST